MSSDIAYKSAVLNVKTAIVDARLNPKPKVKKTRKPRALVNFSHAALFDKKFKPDIETCSCIVGKMVFAKKINIDGSVDVDNMINIRKYELWSYIYYLYYFNNTSIDEFVAMKNTKTGTASAENFYRTVRDVVDNQFVSRINIASDKDEVVVPLDPRTLAYFINMIIHKYEEDLANPIMSYLRELVRQKPKATFDSLIIKTGDNENVKIVPGIGKNANPNAVRDANVKIDITSIGSKGGRPRLRVRI